MKRKGYKVAPVWIFLLVVVYFLFFFQFFQGLSIDAKVRAQAQSGDMLVGARALGSSLEDGEALTDAFVFSYDAKTFDIGESVDDEEKRWNPPVSEEELTEHVTNLTKQYVKEHYLQLSVSENCVVNLGNFTLQTKPLSDRIKFTVENPNASVTCAGGGSTGSYVFNGTIQGVVKHNRFFGLYREMRHLIYGTSWNDVPGTDNNLEDNLTNPALTENTSFSLFRIDTLDSDTENTMFTQGTENYVNLFRTRMQQIYSGVETVHSDNHADDKGMEFLPALPDHLLKFNCTVGGGPGEECTVLHDNTEEPANIPMCSDTRDPSWKHRVHADNAGINTDIDAPSQDTLYITYHDETEDNPWLVETTDGGQNWEEHRISNEPGDAGFENALAATENTVFAAYENDTGDTVTVVAARSTDNGETWTREQLSPTGVEAHTGQLSVAAPSDSVAYVSHTVGGDIDPALHVYKYSAGSWETLQIAAGSFVGAAVDTTAEHRVYVSYLQSQDDGTYSLHVATSSDGGETWNTQRLATDLPIGDTAISMTDTDNGYITYESTGNQLTVVAKDKGAWQSPRTVETIRGRTDISAVDTDTGVAVYANRTAVKKTQFRQQGSAWNTETITRGQFQDPNEEVANPALAAQDVDTLYTSFHNKTGGEHRLVLATHCVNPAAVKEPTTYETDTNDAGDTCAFWDADGECTGTRYDVIEANMSALASRARFLPKVTDTKYTLPLDRLKQLPFHVNYTYPEFNKSHNDSRYSLDRQPSYNVSVFPDDPAHDASGSDVSGDRFCIDTSLTDPPNRDGFNCLNGYDVSDPRWIGNDASTDYPGFNAQNFDRACADENRVACDAGRIVRDNGNCTQAPPRGPGWTSYDYRYYELNAEDIRRTEEYPARINSSVTWPDYSDSNFPGEAPHGVEKRCAATEILAATDLDKQDRDNDNLDDIDEVRGEQGNDFNTACQEHTSGPTYSQSSSTCPDEDDSDFDGLDDDEEISGWEVTVTKQSGRESYEVSSDPNDPNTDTDGWEDDREKTEGTDPTKDDTDDDGVDDDEDDCPLTYGEGANGCEAEPPDSDDDGVPDKDDECDNTPGSPDNNGCPYPVELSVQYWTNDSAVGDDHINISVWAKNWRETDIDGTLYVEDENGNEKTFPTVDDFYLDKNNGTDTAHQFTDGWGTNSLADFDEGMDIILKDSDGNEVQRVSFEDYEIRNSGDSRVQQAVGKAEPFNYWYLGGGSQTQGVKAGARCIEKETESTATWQAGSSREELGDTGGVNGRECMLTKLHGSFDSSNEQVEEYNESGKHYLDGASSGDVLALAANSACIGHNGDTLWYSGPVEWEGGTTYLFPTQGTANQVCFLSKVEGDFAGSSEQVLVDIDSTSFGDAWVIAGNNHGQVDGSARCFETEESNMYTEETEWRQQQVAKRLQPEEGNTCFLSEMQGDFSSSGEHVTLSRD